MPPALTARAPTCGLLRCSMNVNIGGARRRQLAAPIRSAAGGQHLPLVVPSAVIPPPAQGSQYRDSGGDSDAGSGDPGGRGQGGSGGRGGPRRQRTADDPDGGGQQRQGMLKVVKALVVRLLSLMIKYFLVVAAVFNFTGFMARVAQTVYNTGVHVTSGGISSSEVLSGSVRDLAEEDAGGSSRGLAGLGEDALGASSSSHADGAEQRGEQGGARQADGLSAKDGAAAAEAAADDGMGVHAAPAARPRRRVVTWEHVASTWAAILAAPLFFSMLPDSKW